MWYIFKYIMSADWIHITTQQMRSKRKRAFKTNQNKLNQIYKERNVFTCSQRQSLKSVQTAECGKIQTLTSCDSTAHSQLTITRTHFSWNYKAKTLFFKIFPSYLNISSVNTNKLTYILLQAVTTMVVSLSEWTLEFRQMVTQCR